MIYYDLSNTQLEHWADELNLRYREERLTKPSQADVYDIVDLLGARLAIEYITPKHGNISVLPSLQPVCNGSGPAIPMLRE